MVAFTTSDILGSRAQLHAEKDVLQSESSRDETGGPGGGESLITQKALSGVSGMDAVSGTMTMLGREAGLVGQKER